MMALAVKIERLRDDTQYAKRRLKVQNGYYDLPYHPFIPSRLQA
jgi:hypothetical protein